MNTTDDLDTPADEPAVIQPLPDDDEEHDAFGGSTPVNGDTAWATAKASGPSKSAWAWMAAGFVAIAVASGAFFGMRNTANRATNTSANGAADAPFGNAGPNGAADPNGPAGQGAQGAPDGPGRGQRGDGTFGILQSVDGSTLTLQTRDGSTIKVTTTGNTQVTKIVNGTPQAAALKDLTVGEPVMVRGTAGAATAIIQGRPPRGGPGGGGPGFGPPPDDQAPNGQPQQSQQQNVRSA